MDNKPFCQSSFTAEEKCVGPPHPTSSFAASSEIEAALLFFFMNLK